MSTLFLEKHMHPFDILFRNFFDANAHFAPATETKAPHPLDIYENESGLHFEIACTGLDKNEVTINIEGDILKVSNTKTDIDTETDKGYIYKGIAKRSFNLGYKISSKFNLAESEAEMKNGLLKIHVPFAEEAKPKSLKIK